MYLALLYNQSEARNIKMADVSVDAAGGFSLGFLDVVILLTFIGVVGLIIYSRIRKRFTGGRPSTARSLSIE